MLLVDPNYPTIRLLCGGFHLDCVLLCNLAFMLNLVVLCFRLRSDLPLYSVYGMGLLCFIWLLRHFIVKRTSILE